MSVPYAILSNGEVWDMFLTRRISMTKRVIISGMSDFGLISHHERSDMGVFDASKTRQEFAAECDINTIMSRYEATGSVSHVNRAEPMYVDWTTIPDLRDGLELFRGASDAFFSLPAQVRRDFDNDPAKFVEFAQEPSNLEAMRNYGLAPPPPAPPEAIRVKMDPLVPLDPAPAK